MLYGVTGNPDVDGILTPAQQLALERSQENDARAALKYLENPVDPRLGALIQKPTGYGKSRIIAMILQALHQEDEQILFIPGAKGRDILIEQNLNVLQGLLREYLGEDDFSVLPNTDKRIVVGIWPSVVSRHQRSALPNFKNILVDEAHNSGTDYRIGVLNHFAHANRVGFTATSVRSSGAYRHPQDYGFYLLEEILSTLPECVLERWLSSLYGLAIDTRVILPAEVIGSHGNLRPDKVYKALRQYPLLFESIGKDIADRFLSKGMKTIGIVNRIKEEAIPVAQAVRRAGYRVGIIVNSSAQAWLAAQGFDTYNVVARYGLPKEDPDAIDLLLSIYMAGEGFDAPWTECVAWIGPTKSHTRYAQVIGRGARRCPGKAYCVIADYVYTIQGFGYSLNFAQFFNKKDIQEIEEGIYFLGPTDNIPTLPRDLREGAELVDIFGKPLTRRKDVYSLGQLVSKFTFGGEKVVKTVLSLFDIKPIRPNSGSGEQCLYGRDALDLVVNISTNWKMSDQNAEIYDTDSKATPFLLEMLREGVGLGEPVKLDLGNTILWDPKLSTGLSEFSGWRTLETLAADLGLRESDLVFLVNGIPQVETRECLAHEGQRIKLYPPSLLEGVMQLARPFDVSF